MLTYIDKNLCKVRTITSFISLTNDRSMWQSVIADASALCATISQALIEKDYQVQSVRIVTNPFGEYLNTQTLAKAKEDFRYLEKILNENNANQDLRLRFAIGEAKTTHEIALLPELVSEFGDLCNVCVNVSANELGILDNELIIEAAAAVEKISRLTPRGEGNFNFTVNFNCEPLIPYFPASYFSKSLEPQFVIGLETPDLLVHVLNIENLKNEKNHYQNKYEKYYQAMSDALQYHTDQIVSIVDMANKTTGFSFAGVDSSAAPSKYCSSMVEIYRQLGVEHFGTSGTVEASALLTKVFKSVKGVKLVGFSGLMLALTEDLGLAKGSVNHEFDIRALLTYSAVCGIGLDTVPIPGDTSIEKIAALMRDTGTMAYRLNKPLTVRVFPVPGLQAGDITQFESEDLCNCAVLAVP